jgi:hypothetical protein
VTLTTAAGVAGGALLFQGIEQMLSKAIAAGTVKRRRKTGVTCGGPK